MRPLQPKQNCNNPTSTQLPPLQPKTQSCNKPTAAIDAYNDTVAPLDRIRDTYAPMDEYRGPTFIGRMDLSDKRNRVGGWRNASGVMHGRKMGKQMDRKLESWKPPTKIDGKKGKF